MHAIQKINDKNLQKESNLYEALANQHDRRPWLSEDFFASKCRRNFRQFDIAVPTDNRFANIATSRSFGAE